MNQFFICHAASGAAGSAVHGLSRTLSSKLNPQQQQQLWVAQRLRDEALGSDSDDSEESSSDGVSVVSNAASGATAGQSISKRGDIDMRKGW